MHAVRLALFLERAVPVLEKWQEVRAMKVDAASPNLREVLGAKLSADKVVPFLEAMIYPEDDVE